MSIYLIANIQVRATRMSDFKAAMARIKAITGEAGWKLAAAYALRTGRLNMVIDIWELRDFDHMDAGMQALATHAEFPRIQAILQETVVEETLSFADALDYPDAGPI